MSSPFQNTSCTVVVKNNFDTYGTITRSSVDGLTPAELELLFKPDGTHFADMDAFFKTAFEMNACGIKRNGLYDWIWSSARNVKPLVGWEKIDRGPSLLHPFILGRQLSVFSTDYWAIPATSYGWAQNAYTATVTGPLTQTELNLGSASDRVVRIITRAGFDMNAEWFQAKSDGTNGDLIHILSRVAGATLMGQWRVLASAVASDSSYVDVLITSQNTGSNASYDHTPGAGSNASVVLRGGNNVNDYEAYCLNRPTLDPRKRVPFFYKTDRRARQVDSEYIAVFKRLMESNEFFQEFGDLPMAERNRQDEENYQRAKCIDFFFNKAISSNQTLSSWQSLDTITTVSGASIDPGLGGKVIAYRAEPVGVFEQLRACGQVRDLQNQTLNFYDFLQVMYDIMRARLSSGHTASARNIDVYTDSVTAAQFQFAAITYWKAKLVDTLRLNIEQGSNELGFIWKTYEFDYPAGVKINIITHEFFDDLVNAANTESIDSAGRMMLILELGRPGAGGRGGSIYPGTIASNRKVRTLGEIEKLAQLDKTFACTMEYPTDEITLTSETWTVICECPLNSLIITGIASGAFDATSGLSDEVSPSLLYDVE
jgi:hypothetical protein